MIPKFLSVLVIKYFFYSCLSIVKKFGAVILRFMIINEQIKKISLRIRWKRNSQLNWRLVFLIQWEQESTSSRLVHLPTPPNWPLIGWKATVNNRVISRKTDFEWAPHSPDLSPPDFFLWSYLNDWVCKTNPRTIGELKKTSKRRLKPLTKKPGALWCPTSSAAWRCVSIRKEDIWSNCSRTGYTLVRVLIFYVTVLF